jgi:RNA polymerase sigma-70 factor (ECF subfamily)
MGEASAHNRRFAGDAAMERYADGDPRGFEELYDLLAPRLWAYALRRTRNPSVAKDVVQQTFLKIHAARGRFIRGAPVLPWAFAIAARLVSDGAREGRYELLETAPDGELPDVASSDASADAVLQAKALAHRLEQALERLPCKQREAFQLIRQEELSYADAARVLGTSVVTVKLRVHRARLALRDVLGDETA